MQTRMDAEIVVLFGTESEARICKVQNREANNSRIRNKDQNQKSDKQAKQARQKRNHKTKGCLVLSLNKLAYTNRHRVKINVLMARQMNRLKCIYTGELNTLRGSWDVRKD